MQADEYRKNAAECRDIAHKTSDPQTKAQWIKLAEEWTRLAGAAHVRPQVFDAK